MDTNEFRDLCQVMDMSRLDVATLAGTTHRNVERWEAGHTRVPLTLARLLRLMHVKRIKPADAIRLTGELEPQPTPARPPTERPNKTLEASKKIGPRFAGRMRRLDDREKDVIEARLRKESLASIADRLALSKGRAQQIEEEALDKLKMSPAAWAQTAYLAEAKRRNGGAEAEVT